MQTQGIDLGTGAVDLLRIEFSALRAQMTE
jgi:hypothetical protein